MDKDLRATDLRGVDFRGADLRGANLCRSILRGANLSRADLTGANLRGADLRGADLSRADLHGVDMLDANLEGVRLEGACLHGANIPKCDETELALARLKIVPEFGAFMGWKKCQNGAIVLLQIPSEASRSNLDRQCCASFVDVCEVFGAEYGVSIHDGKTRYEPGTRIISQGLGIHFYLTRIEAEHFGTC